MNEDTAKPSNEGSGRNISKMREVDVRKVADSELRAAFNIKGFGDIQVLSTDPYVVDISRENNNSSSTSNASNGSTTGSGIIETESKAESNLDEIIARNYVQAPLKQQDEKSRNARKAKAAAKARENADKNADKNKDEGPEK